MTYNILKQKTSATVEGGGLQPPIPLLHLIDSTQLLSTALVYGN